MKEKGLDKNAIEKIKEALRYVKIARHQNSDYVSYVAMIGGDTFLENFIKPLEEACGWTKEDEEKTLKAGKEFHEEAKGKTLPEKSHKLAELVKQKKWWIGGTIAAITTGIGVAVHFYRKKKNGNKKTNTPST